MDSNRVLILATKDGIGTIPVQRNGHLGEPEFSFQGTMVEAVCRDATGTCFAGSDEGRIFRSEASGKWEETFKGFAGTRGLWALAAHPVRAMEIYAGLEPAAVWVSRDGGSRWEELSALRKHPSSKKWRFYEPMKPHIRAIAFNRDGTELHIGIEEGGNLISIDGGHSFEDRTVGADPDVHTILVADKNPNLIFAMTGDGLYRSLNAGIQWERLEEGLDRGYVVPMSTISDDENSLCVGAAGRSPGAWGSHGADAVIYRSEDGGDTWNMSEGPFPLRGMVVSIVSDMQNRKCLFAGTNDGMILQSVDEGLSWTVALKDLPRIEEVTIQ